MEVRSKLSGFKTKGAMCIVRKKPMDRMKRSSQSDNCAISQQQSTDDAKKLMLELTDKEYLMVISMMQRIKAQSTSTKGE